MRIICILGRSGSGKSTIEKKLEQLGYNRIISYTTRKPRGNEQDGVDYHFVNTDQFKYLISKNILMEHAEYSGNYYGAPRPVGSINNVIVVETEGYIKIKQIYGSQVIGVYVDTPLDIINQRLEIRDDTDDIELANRYKEDNRKFEEIKEIADLIIDGTQSADVSVIQILKFIKQQEMRCN